MWISNNKFKELEKRIADLERQVQGQQKRYLVVNNDITKLKGKTALIRV